MPRYGVKVVKPGKPPKVLTALEGTKYTDAETLKVMLMQNTQDDDTEYYIVPIERNK